MSAQKQNHFYVHKEYLKMTTIKIRFELYVSIDKIHLEKLQTIEKLILNKKELKRISNVSMYQYLNQDFGDKATSRG